jgi:CubicO group peptidase (beta-lactamase class C family)
MQTARIESLLTEVVRAGSAPGAAVCLSAREELVFAASGSVSHIHPAPITRYSRFQLGCITKLLTALVALEFASEAKLELEAPLRRYVRELEGTPVGEEVRVRHLLSHTAGYQGFNVADPRIRYCSSWSTFIAALRERQLLFPPGRVFNYEHTEYVLLGEILQRIAGTSIYNLYVAKIFEPLELQCGRIATDSRDSTRYVPEHSFDAKDRSYATLRPAPHCEFWDASLSDLTMNLGDMRSLAAAAAGWDVHRIFSASTIAQLRAPQVALPTAHGGRQSEQMPAAFGLGLAEYADAIFGHNGSARGHTCALRFDPQSGLVLLVALNAWRPHARDLLVARIASTLRENSTQDQSRSPASETGAVPGLYVGANGTSVEVSEEAGWLRCRFSARSLKQEFSIEISRSDQGLAEFRSNPAHATIGFFKVPGTSDVGLMLGLNAYRRIEHSAAPSA